MLPQSSRGDSSTPNRLRNGPDHAAGALPLHPQDTALSVAPKEGPFPLSAAGDLQTALRAVISHSPSSKANR